MEQKKFIKFGLSQAALESHVQLIEHEVSDYIATSPHFRGSAGTVDVCAVMAEITIFTAARALQGEEVRCKLTTEFASLYHDLDKGFRPVNFMLPWAPLPHNRKRDAAHAHMRAIYMDIINKRRSTSGKEEDMSSDMIWNLMRCVYKDGTPIPDHEIAHMMITLLMAGQHSSSSIGSWILLRLGSRPDITEELHREQQIGANMDRGLDYATLDKLPLHQNVIKETLRLHSSIHSLMRKVKNHLPVSVAGSNYVIPPTHVLLASPGVTALSDEFFPRPGEWDPHRWDRAAPTPTDPHPHPEGGTGTPGGRDEVVDYGYGAVSKGTSSPYLPFGAGRHRCIGEKFAYVNLEVILATLVRHFKFGALCGNEDVPRTDYSSLFSGPAKPAVIRWERRGAGSGVVA